MDKIDTKNLLSQESEAVNKKVKLEHQDKEISIDEKAELELTATKVSDKDINVHFETTLEPELKCDRCLKKFNKQIKIEFDQIYSTKPEIDQLKIIDDQIDIKAPLLEELIVSIPTKRICQADCQGLCQICGQNLNLEVCDCEPAKEGHPELQKIEKIKDKISKKKKGNK
jgi:uncharacterized protein